MTAILEMELDKVLKPDGSTARFYKSCWNIIKYDLWRMINYMKWKGKFYEATNSSILAMLHKECDPSSFLRFHLISLCNTSYKIITKIIANTLKDLLNTLISKNQGGFIQERQVLDNILLV